MLLLASMSKVACTQKYQFIFRYMYDVRSNGLWTYPVQQACTLFLQKIENYHHLQCEEQQFLSFWPDSVGSEMVWVGPSTGSLQICFTHIRKTHVSQDRNFIVKWLLVKWLRTCSKILGCHSESQTETEVGSQGLSLFLPPSHQHWAGQSQRRKSSNLCLEGYSSSIQTVYEHTEHENAVNIPELQIHNIWLHHKQLHPNLPKSGFKVFGL